MAKKTNMQTVAVRNNNTGKVKMGQPTQGVAGTGSNIVGRKGETSVSTKGNKALVPSLSLSSRYSPYIDMLRDPIHARPALPPLTLPARAIPLKQYQEVLLSTDANGAAAVSVYPRMYSQYFTASTIVGSTVTGYNTASNNVEAASFSSNFYQFVPTVMEVVVKYTGSTNVVAGRMYGIVSPNTSANLDLTTFPLEPNGCEAVTSDGISCTWYSTSQVWNNPTGTTNTVLSTEWGDARIVVGLIGGPASSTNLLTVGIYLHMAAVPNSGICGLTPQPSFPDVNAASAAHLFQMSEDGLGASALSIPARNKSKAKWKGHVRDLLKVGGQVVGTVAPHLSQAATVAEAMALLLL